MHGGADAAGRPTCGNDYSLRLWDAETLELLLEFSGHRSCVPGVAWNPDGSMLASVSGDHLVRIWDEKPRKQRYRQQQARRAMIEEISEHLGPMGPSTMTGADVLGGWG